MEDKCVICGADVSDMSTQVCVNCTSKTIETLLNKDKIKLTNWQKNFLKSIIPKMKRN